MNESPQNALDRKKFLIQILIAVGISILFQFLIDPYIYDPFIREVIGGMEGGDAIVICSLSMWFFSFTCVYFYYPDNEILVNYLFCSLIPLSVIVGFEFARLFFIDFLHIPPLIAGIYILIKQRRHLNIKAMAVTSTIVSIWFLIVRLVGTNYTIIPLNVGLIFVFAYPLLHVFLVFLINYFDKKK